MCNNKLMIKSLHKVLTLSLHARNLAHNSTATLATQEGKQPPRKKHQKQTDHHVRTSCDCRPSGHSPPAKKGKAPKSPKKAGAAKPKGAKAAASHPPTTQMVINAVKSLKERNGSSLQAVKKFIADTYKVDTTKQATFIRKAITKLVETGKLTQTKGTGASGSFKIPVAAKAAAGEKKAKSPKKKTTKPKKAASPKKKAAPKAKKAASPKKKAAAKPKKAKAAPSAPAAASSPAAPKPAAAKKPKKSPKAKAPKVKLPKAKKAKSPKKAKPAKKAAPKKA
ncbi:Histone H1 [Folsomia candida]|uniref:Histone H1 n=2 Tax=Folsomia candida TaxID=158441 RepID=A0A226EV51_FOLCA|nr:Histone H1 [Folsomia candida]